MEEEEIEFRGTPEIPRRVEIVSGCKHSEISGEVSVRGVKHSSSLSRK